MMRYVVLDPQGEFLEVKGQDVFKTREDAEKAMGKRTGFEIRPVPVGAPIQVLKPRVAPAEKAREEAKKPSTKPSKKTSKTSENTASE